MEPLSPSIIPCALAAYLTGAIPFGFLIARAKGIDIRTKGSGNIGATNIFRSVSKKLGVLTFLLDVLKGFISTYAYPLAAAGITGTTPDARFAIICACCSVAGHNWPIFLKFKGGKGIATTAGALLGIAPLALCIGLAVWIIIFPISRYVSLASISAAVAIPCAGWFLYPDKGLLIPSFLTFLGALAILRHKDNIVRLVKGTENRFEFKKKGSSKNDN